MTSESSRRFAFSSTRTESIHLASMLKMKDRQMGSSTRMTPPGLIS